MSPGSNRARLSRRWLSVLGGLVALAIGLGVWSIAIEPNRLVLRSVDLPLATWPASHSPLKVALLADLHAGAPFMTAEKFAKIAALTNAAEPDLILLLGDYVSHGVLGRFSIEPETWAPPLAELSAPLGVYAVLGNHDWWFDGPRVRAVLEKAGITVLDNEMMFLDHRGDAVQLAGIGDFWAGSPDITGTLAAAGSDAPILLMTHNPDLIRQVPARVALTVAGHTHGGQVNLPLVGRLVVPSDYGQRYAYGHVDEHGRHLFVTAGIGTSILPVRLNQLPEVVILTVRSQSN